MNGQAQLGGQEMLAILLVMAIFFSTTALLYARWEYRKRGRLTVLGLTLLLVMIFTPNLLLDYATTYEMPSTAVDYVGLVIGGLGFALCLVSMTTFRSVTKILCLNPGQLSTAGPYRYSRNPQYLGYFAFLVGYALNDWSLWCLAALLVVAISLHLLVLIEEEHLLRIFGDPYAEFRRKVPRYVGRMQAGT